MYKLTTACKWSNFYLTGECSANKNHMHYSEKDDVMLFSNLVDRTHVVINYVDLLEFLLRVQAVRRLRTWDVRIAEMSS